MKNVLITGGTGFLGAYLKKSFFKDSNNLFIDNENNSWYPFIINEIFR